MRYRLVFPAFLLGLLLLVACRGSTSPQLGRPAPAFTLPSLADGSPVSLDQFRGKVVLLNFFATWCPACRAEMPHLQGAWEEVQDEGVAFLIIDIAEESTEMVAQFMKERGITIPVVMNQTGDVATAYNIHVLPTTFVLDRGGVVRSITLGAFTNKEAILARVRAVSR
ncbi:MAG TPA: TlpA disulfide reductase family protein [Dehalococcoidia bacterium]|nr:TlpA disulfide reductase family protein [Dehalococcoidia bacterium]